MSDARKFTQLISQSLRQRLKADDTLEMAQHLEQDEQSRAYANLSREIQNSVSLAAESIAAGKDEKSPGLSKEARQRMQDSVDAATVEKLKLSQSGLIRTAPDPVQPVNEPPQKKEKTHVQVTSQPGNHADSQRQVTSRFRLLRTLGEGGLGNVWLARDEKLNRNVAVKELNAEALETATAWQRFQREAEITGMLEHPNIVPIYQYGDDRKSGEPFYAMRFVGKRTLSDAIVEYHDLVEAGEDEQLGLHRLLSVFLDICQAIAYAHSRGVIHRDLKPENVALDNFGQVIVLDWGLAKLTDDGDLAHKISTEASLSDSAMSRTTVGDIVGTPLYMAPEQAKGDLDHINERTDVYGLGAVLFAILTGDAPHARSVADKQDLRQAIVSIAERESPRSRSLRATIPLELDEICAKAMARKPHLRYASVQHLSEAIERWMVGQGDKQAQYEAMRMEGRELRADLQSIVNDLERNVRFMSKLPPIQQLITATLEEDVLVWRERLATIFQGLLEANPDYRTVVYQKVTSDEFTELVRVERHSRDVSRIRVVPRSKLRTSPSSPFINSVLQQKPEEGVTSLVCDAMCDVGDTNSRQQPDDLGLASGVPIYDDRTEDAFGIVMIDCDIERVLRRQFGHRFKSAELVAACDVFHVMMHNQDGSIMEDSIGKSVADVVPQYTDAVSHLQTNAEYIDANAEIYGARIWFIPNNHGLMYLLRRS